MDITAKANERIEELTDQLKKAMKLLGRVKAVHAAAIRNGDAAVSSLTSRLLHEIEMLENEIADSEGRHNNAEVH